MKAKLSRGKVSMCYGQHDRTVAACSKWRASHPEIANIDKEIKSIQLPKIPKVARAGPEK